MTFKKCFVILGAQRTGSNFLVSALDSVSDVRCFGELFNPKFIDTKEYSEKRLKAGIDDVSMRNQNPIAFLDRCIDETAETNVGFKLFPGHDSQVHNHVLNDQNIKKIFLRRNVLDSYVSLESANKSNVWVIRKTKDADLLKEIRDKSNMPIEFKADKFMLFKSQLENFWNKNFRKEYYCSSNTYDFWYSQIGDIRVLRELLNFLEVGQSLKTSDLNKLGKTVKQSQKPIKDKVSNYAEMLEFLTENSLEHLIGN